MQFGSNEVHPYGSQALSNPDEVLRLVIQAVNQNRAGRWGRLPGSTCRRRRSWTSSPASDPLPIHAPDGRRHEG